MISFNGNLLFQIKTSQLIFPFPLTTPFWKQAKQCLS
jgi:hypothetical protein